VQCQRRTAVFDRAATGPGPIDVLHKEVAERFAEVASGRPANVSTAQLVQLLFEVGAADSRSTEVSAVLSKLMMHGFFRYGHSQKRDSYGPPQTPVVGLDECKRWATLLFVERLKAQEQQATTPSWAAARGMSTAGTGAQ